MADPSTQDCHVALELSRARWLVGALLPGRSRVTAMLVPGGDTAALLEVLSRFAARAGRGTGQAASVRVCLETGYDGSWLARFLLARGIETRVLDPASVLVSRRGRRAKTDRIDAEAMAFTLRAFPRGDRGVCRAVVAPSPEQEDAKHLSRERTQLAAEKTRHTNRIRGLLTLHGIRGARGLWGGDWAEAPDELRTGDGRGLGGHLHPRRATAPGGRPATAVKRTWLNGELRRRRHGRGGAVPAVAVDGEVRRHPTSSAQPPRSRHRPPTWRRRRAGAAARLTEEAFAARPGSG